MRPLLIALLATLLLATPASAARFQHTGPEGAALDGAGAPDGACRGAGGGGALLG